MQQITQEEDEKWAELSDAENDKIKKDIGQNNADYGACVDVARLENWECKFYREGFINDIRAIPSKVVKHPFIHAKCEFYETGSYKDVGKWMLFIDTNKIDKEWERAWEGLGLKYFDGVHHIKCSTAHESQAEYNPKTKVIIFYSKDSANEARIMAIGRQILYRMQYTESAYIYYKTDEQTRAGKVAGSKNHLYKLYTRNKNWRDDYDPDKDADIIYGRNKNTADELGELDELDEFTAVEEVPTIAPPIATPKATPKATTRDDGECCNKSWNGWGCDCRGYSTGNDYSGKNRRR